MHLHLLDFIILALYMLGLIAVGFFFAGRQKDNVTYFLGNRQVHWFLAGISVIATLLSTMSYLAMPGEMIRFGAGLFTELFAYILIIPIVNYLIIPWLMSLKVTSVYAYLEQRFSLSTRMVAASAFILSRIIWIGMITYSVSFAVAEMTGWSTALLIIFIGGITTLYTTMGGISAVLWTDFIQFVILFAGAVFVPVYIALATNTSPLAWWDTFSDAGRTEVPVFSLDPTVRVTVIGAILLSTIWNVCTHGADQVAAQRYMSTSSAGEARQAVWVFSIANIGLTVLLALCGLALFYYFFVQSGLPVQVFQGNIAPEADKIFPRFIASDLPAGISGLILAALLSAAMSSLSSGINSISNVVVTDFLERFKILTKYQGHLYLAKGTGVTVGLLGVCSALTVNRFMQSGEWNLIDLMERGNHLFVAPLGVLFFVGFLFRRADSRAALGGFLAGVATSVSVSFSKEIFGLEYPVGFVWILPISFLVSFVATYLLNLVFSRTGPRAPQVSNAA